MVRFLLFSKEVIDLNLVAKNTPKGFSFLGSFVSEKCVPEAEIILTTDHTVEEKVFPKSAIIHILPKVEVDDDEIHFFKWDFKRSRFSLKDLLMSVLSNIPHHPKHFIFSTIKESFILRSTEILYLKADGHSVDVYFIHGGKLTLFQHLGWFEKRLPLPFFRVQKSYIVNGAMVTQIRRVKKQLWLRGLEKTVIPFGVQYTYQVELLEGWIRERGV